MTIKVKGGNAVCATKNGVVTISGKKLLQQLQIPEDDSLLLMEDQ